MRTSVCYMEVRTQEEEEPHIYHASWGLSWSYTCVHTDTPNYASSSLRSPHTQAQSHAISGLPWPKERALVGMSAEIGLLLIGFSCKHVFCVYLWVLWESKLWEHARNAARVYCGCASTCTIANRHKQYWGSSISECMLPVHIHINMYTHAQVHRKHVRAHKARVLMQVPVWMYAQVRVMMRVCMLPVETSYLCKHPDQSEAKRNVIQVCL